LTRYLGLRDEEALVDLLDGAERTSQPTRETSFDEALSEVQANAAAVRRLTEGFAVAMEKGYVSGESATAFATKALDFLTQ